MFCLKPSSNSGLSQQSSDLTCHKKFIENTVMKVADLFAQNDVSD